MLSSHAQGSRSRDSVTRGEIRLQNTKVTGKYKDIQRCKVIGQCEVSWQSFQGGMEMN